MKIKFTKKVGYTLTLAALFSSIHISCSKDSEKKPKEKDFFTIDSEKYEIDIAYITIMLDKENPKLSHAMINLTGLNNASNANFSTVLAFPNSESISGIYGPAHEVLSEWKYSKQLTFYGLQQGTKFTHINDANGEVKVQHHSGKEYTIYLNLEFTDGKKLIGNIRRNFETASIK